MKHHLARTWFKGNRKANATYNIFLRSSPCLFSPADLTNNKFLRRIGLTLLDRELCEKELHQTKLSQYFTLPYGNMCAWNTSSPINSCKVCSGSVADLELLLYSTFLVTYSILNRSLLATVPHIRNFYTVVNVVMEIPCDCIVWSSQNPLLLYVSFFFQTELYRGRMTNQLKLSVNFAFSSVCINWKPFCFIVHIVGRWNRFVIFKERLGTDSKLFPGGRWQPADLSNPCQPPPIRPGGHSHMERRLQPCRTGYIHQCGSSSRLDWWSCVRIR